MYKWLYLEDGLDCPKYIGTNVNIILLYISYYIAYSLTGSMEQSLSWETNRFSGSREISPFHGNQRFTTAFTSACHLSLSWAQFVFHNMIYFYGCLRLTQPLSWNAIPCQLPTTAYSLYSKLASILEAVIPSATWGHSMPWWQVPSDLGYIA